MGTETVDVTMEVAARIRRFAFDSTLRGAAIGTKVDEEKVRFVPRIHWQ